ncbi:MAG: prepilin-type N-terminal cleavage/methylation domain-containing protein [Sedimentisphaerales bacterium]|nr:prepilin-type N-terminal cleavage/methylation domain-containing protein [Sedimentisphaerales bacterium]
MSLPVKKSSGLTLIEIMVSIAIILVVVVGAVSFRYYAAMDAREADVKISAARIGNMLLDAWKGTGGSATYDPVSEFGLDLNISISATGPNVPTGFIKLDSYLISSNRVSYYATLSYKDSTSTTPGVLTVTISWLNNYQSGTVSVSDESVKLTTFAKN